MLSTFSRVAAAFLAVSLLVGCTGGSGDDDPATAASAPPTAAPSAAQSADGDGAAAGPSPSGDSSPDELEVGGPDCALTEEPVRRVVRDWQRVDGSIGRPDHARYTGALVRRLARLDDDAAGCRGERRFRAFVQTVRRIDVRAERPRTDYDLYDRAVELGDAWLRASGLGVKALSRG